MYSYIILSFALLQGVSCVWIAASMGQYVGIPLFFSFPGVISFPFCSISWPCNVDFTCFGTQIITDDILPLLCLVVLIPFHYFFSFCFGFYKTFLGLFSRFVNCLLVHVTEWPQRTLHCCAPLKRWHEVCCKPIALLRPHLGLSSSLKGLSKWVKDGAHWVKKKKGNEYYSPHWFPRCCSDAHLVSADLHFLVLSRHTKPLTGWGGPLWSVIGRAGITFCFLFVHVGGGD